MFDISIWINYIKGVNEVRTELLKDKIFSSYNNFICPPIVQEILQGVSDARKFTHLKSIIDDIKRIEANPYEMSVLAAQMYFHLRKKGITIRKPNDCLIATYAINSNITLVHNDKGYDELAKECPFKIFYNCSFI